jgi:hypothetical protein
MGDGLAAVEEAPLGVHREAALAAQPIEQR